MKNSKGEMAYETTEIANVFQSYYSTVYSVREKETQEAEMKRRKKMQVYLREAKLPKVSIETLQALKDSITYEEIRTAINSTAVGKSPGRDRFTIKIL